MECLLQEMNPSIPIDFCEDEPLITSNEGESTILVLREWPMDRPNLQKV
jgi:hypothetical protein